MGTLTGAEMNGAPIALTGDALLSGYYVNELMLKLLHRHDPQPELFAVYEAAIRALNGAPNVASVLRRFEIDALALLGYALNLDHDMRSGQELDPGTMYEYRVEQGPIAASRQEGPMLFSGRELSGVRRGEFSDPAVLSAAARLLRHVIDWHLDGAELQSRRVLRDMRKSAAPKGM